MTSRRTTKPRRTRPVTILRRLSQLAFLILFLVLFLQTDYNGTDRLDSAVNLFFRLNPYLGASVVLAVKSIIVLLWPALLVLLFTVLFGRLFCGWFCPMGTMLDICRKFVPTRDRENNTFFPGFGLLLVVFSLVGALFGMTVAGYLDPFSLLVRGLALGVYPAVNSATVDIFTYTYREMPSGVNLVTEPVYSVLRDFVLPSGQKFFALGVFSVALLLVILLLERRQRRFFCRNVCPLGAMLGFCGQRALLNGHGGDESCGACRLCIRTCRMGAINQERRISTGSCNFCYECVERCPRQIIFFDLSPRQRQSQPVSLRRRRFLLAGMCGMALPLVARAAPLQQRPDPLLIRPPGALAEDQFRGRCVRCGECMQVCIGNALQPTLLEAGFDGFFSPVLKARTGYCEFNCTLCGQVCPTGAIAQLTMAEKHRFKIGHAWFDTDLCLPYARAIPCMVCEEHCPTPEKAIRFKTVQTSNDKGELITIKQPYVVDELCIGCGICENKCPLPGRAAIYVTSAGEQRHPERALSTGGGYSPYDSGGYPG